MMYMIYMIYIIYMIYMIHMMEVLISQLPYTGHSNQRTGTKVLEIEKVT